MKNQLNALHYWYNRYCNRPIGYRVSIYYGGICTISVFEVMVSIQTLSDHFGTLLNPKKFGSDIWLSISYLKAHLIHAHSDVAKSFCMPKNMSKHRCQIKKFSGKPVSVKPGVHVAVYA